MDNEKLIKQLAKCRDLYNEREAVSRDYDDNRYYGPGAQARREEIANNAQKALDDIAARPVPLELWQDSAKETGSNTWVLAAIAGFFVCIVLSGIKVPFFITLLIAVAVGIGLQIFLKKGNADAVTNPAFIEKSKKKQFTDTREAWLAKYGSEKEYEQQLHAFLDACVAYDEAFLMAYAAYDAVMQDHAAEQNEHIDNLLARRAELTEELEQIVLIQKEHYHLAGDVVRILQQGRADDLKEALNMAVEDERHRQEEARRQAEAARQAAILQEQADEARRHNEAMERHAEEQAAHNRAVEEAMSRAEQERAHALRKREAVAGASGVYRRGDGAYVDWMGHVVPTPTQNIPKKK